MSKKYIVGALVFVILLVVFVAYRISNTGQVLTVWPVASTPIASNADWKSYANVGESIKLKYPPFLTESSNCHMEGTCFTSIDYEYAYATFDDGSGYTYPKAGVAVVVNAVPRTAHFSLDEYCEYAFLWRNVASCTDDVVDGLPAKTQSWALENGQDYGSETIVITENYYVYLYQMYTDPLDKNKLEGILETIELEK